MEKPSTSPDTAGSLLPQSDLEDERRDALPAIDLRDARTWWFYRNGDGNEMVEAVSVAEHWARSMQKLIADGAPLEEIWIRTFEASCDVPSEHSLRLAVTILARSWRHGEALRELYDDHREDIDFSSNDLFYS